MRLKILCKKTYYAKRFPPLTDLKRSWRKIYVCKKIMKIGKRKHFWMEIRREAAKATKVALRLLPCLIFFPNQFHRWILNEVFRKIEKNKTLLGFHVQWKIVENLSCGHQKTRIIVLHYSSRVVFYYPCSDFWFLA